MKLDEIEIACRLNSFLMHKEQGSREPLSYHHTLDLIRMAGDVASLSSVDLNYPEHLEKLSGQDLRKCLMDSNLALNGFSMRYNGDPMFKLGAFSNPIAHVRETAVMMTCKAADLLQELGGKVLTLWMATDGFDYPLQVDYQKSWQLEVEGIRRIAERNPAIDISIEYKPNDPRAFSFINSIGTTLLIIKDVGLPNIGVTIDFCHSLCAGEQPAFAAVLASRYSKLLGIHLNDGYARVDDGLMVGSNHFYQTLELLYYLFDLGFRGVIYLDTFPRNENPVEECRQNVTMIRRMINMIESMGKDVISKIMADHDALSLQRLLLAKMLPD